MANFGKRFALVIKISFLTQLKNEGYNECGYNIYKTTGETRDLTEHFT